MILLDNLLQYLLFIAMINLSRTCDITASLIYNALLIFMTYFWIKIKLKVLIFSANCCPHLILIGFAYCVSVGHNTCIVHQLLIRKSSFILVVCLTNKLLRNLVFDTTEK
jgi:hypothetical protein